MNKVASSAGMLKEIPLASLIIDLDHNPRLALKECRIEFFVDIYGSGDTGAVGPILVIPVQTGDPKTIKYAVYEGFHRVEAKTRLKETTILANISERTFTINDIDTVPFRADIFYLSCKENSGGPLSLTRDERMAAARRLFKEFRYSDKEISETGLAPERTVERWLQELKRGENDAMKSKALVLLEEGNTQEQIALILQREDHYSVTQQTISNWVNFGKINKLQENATGENLLKQKIHHAGTAIRIPLAILGPRGQEAAAVGFEMPEKEEIEKTTGSEFPLLAEKEKAKIISRLEKIAEMLEAMQWSEEADHYAESYLLYAVSNKSSLMARLIRREGYAGELKALRSEYHQLAKDFRSLSITVREKEAEIEKLMEQLKSAKHSCKKNCDTAKNWARTEFERSLSFITQTFRRQVDILSNSNGDMKEDLRDLTVRCLWVMMSNFEWGTGHAIVTTKVVDLFSSFNKTFEELKRINGDNGKWGTAIKKGKTRMLNNLELRKKIDMRIRKITAALTRYGQA